MKRILLIIFLIIGFNQCPDNRPVQADDICVDCSSSSSATDILDAGDFDGANIGAKINNAIAEFSATQAGLIIVPTASWCGQSYSTQIVVDKPVHIMFPGSGCQATYTGATSAIKITGAGSRSKVSGFSVSEAGNVNANVDGVLVDATDAQLVDCVFEWFYIVSPVRHGINFDAKDNGLYMCSFKDGRVLTPGGNNINIDSTGTAKANSNSFTSIGIDTPPANQNGIRIADGYANSFKDIYIQAGAVSAWGIYTSGEFELFENITVDNTMELGFKIDAGFAVINGIRNNATITPETITSPGQITKTDYSGNVVTGADVTVTGIEAGDATIQVWADEGDDTADKWIFKALASGGLSIIEGSTTQATIDTGGIFTATGVIRAASGATAAPGLSFSANTNTGIYNAAGVMTLTVLGVDVEAVGLNHSFRAAGCFRWSSTSAPAGAADIILCRQAAGSLSLTSIEAADAIFNLWADEGDDVADKYSWTSVATTNSLILKNGTTTLQTITSAGEVNIVTISAETSNVVCVKSDGDLGTCTSTVGATGECTCS